MPTPHQQHPAPQLATLAGYISRLRQLAMLNGYVKWRSATFNHDLFSLKLKGSADVFDLNLNQNTNKHIILPLLCGELISI